MSGKVQHRLSARKHDLVEYEVAQEKAAALRRSADRLEEALRALGGVHATAGARAAGSGDGPSRRDELVAAAAEALWFYVVQREACGFRDSEVVLRELHVPREVQLRMGIRKKPR